MIETNDPFFSIIIPVYKVEDYLKECLDSVLEQTFKNYECILINDGSPDNCPQICDEYAFCYENISVIHQSNSGLSVARNKGIEKARGDYIIFLDSDDKLAGNNSLLSLYSLINEKKNVDVIYNCSYQTLVQNKKTEVFFTLCHKKYNNLSFSKLSIRKNLLLAAWLFVINRNFLITNEIFFQCNIFHEDEHWFARIISYSNYIYINSEIFYSYRQQREGSIISTFNEKKFLDKIWIIEDLLKSNPSNKIYSYRECFLLYTLFMDLVKNDFINEFYIAYIKKRKKILLCFLRIRFLILFSFIYFFGTRITFNIFKILRRLQGV